MTKGQMSKIETGSVSAPLSTIDRIAQTLEAEPGLLLMRRDGNNWHLPDTGVRVECIESCRSEHRPSRYPTVTAGEHIQSRIAASQASEYQERST
jgi:hypothetical protein